MCGIHYYYFEFRMFNFEFNIFLNTKFIFQKIAMQSTAQTPQQYLDELPPDRKEAIGKIREAILNNLPEGFEEVMGYGMLGYVVPHSIYPKGYH